MPKRSLERSGSPDAKRRRRFGDTVSYVWYRVDRRGTLTAVGGDWTKFASNNGGQTIADFSSVIGKCLFDFICDSETISVYRQMHDMLFAKEMDEVVLNQRCDNTEITRRCILCVQVRMCCVIVVVVLITKYVDDDGDEPYILYESLVMVEEDRDMVISPREITQFQFCFSRQACAMNQQSKDKKGYKQCSMCLLVEAPEGYPRNKVVDSDHDSDEDSHVPTNVITVDKSDNEADNNNKEDSTVRMDEEEEEVAREEANHDEQPKEEYWIEAHDFVHAAPTAQVYSGVCDQCREACLKKGHAVYTRRSERSRVQAHDLTSMEAHNLESDDATHPVASSDLDFGLD